MSKPKEEKVRKDGVEKKHKKDKKDKKEKKLKTKTVEPASEKKSFSLLADDKTADPTLSSLFAVKVCVLCRLHRRSVLMTVAYTSPANLDFTSSSTAGARLPGR